MDLPNLVVGNSQVSKYLPVEYERISSRNIPKGTFKRRYNRVYLTFGLSVKGLRYDYYHAANVFHMLDMVKRFSKISEKVIVYSTCELWSAYNGQVDLSMPISFQEEPYIRSKYEALKEIKKLDLYNIIFLFPYNFNSIHRSEDFLFGKVIQSIINKKKISIGNTDFYRDISHARWIAERSLESNCDMIIGSGCLTHVNRFIRSLYKEANLDYDEFVTEIPGQFSFIKQTEFYTKQATIYTTEQMIVDYTKELTFPGDI
jgi:GDP-D-mannose dehydratase